MNEWGGQRERDTQNLKQVPSSEPSEPRSEPDVGLKPTNREIVTWAKVGHLTDWATQAPLIYPIFNPDLLLCFLSNFPTLLPYGQIR